MNAWLREHLICPRDREQVTCPATSLYAHGGIDIPTWIESLWKKALGVAAGSLDRGASKFLIAAVARTYEDNYQHDFMPILVGRQGCGKSTFCRELVTPGDGWFVDGLDMAATPKELTESTMGAVIVEFSELVGIRRADVERLKPTFPISTLQGVPYSATELLDVAE